MYEAYFQLQKRPFSATPDPSCFFAPEPIQELFDELVLRAESGQGIGILTAHAGTGKTLVCRRIAAELGGRFTPIFLANANFPTRRALLQSILFELKKRFSGLEEQELRLAVYASLKELTLAGRGVVLIVDEAHLLNE
ncbi:MAG: ExeA family protein, partial [Deltaproteobacteria bacterium]